ncbi:MAG TPA: phospholipid carrier-dependent glycosyltransferase [Gemmataceae bacterium]|nr:phospholipid carrier-dependent glycosyltransferase [Gemmataceae bacterium]
MQEVATPPRTTSPSVSVKSTTVETPTHLLGWLPTLWTHVLFAGSTPPATVLRAAPLAAIVVVSGLLLYPCMAFPLFEPDEGRYAQIPREMLTAGEWIVPTLQGGPYLDKPPLFYWLVMLSYTLFGYHDWAARLIPALSMQGTVLLIYLLGRRMVGERSACWGALLLTVSPIFLGVGRLLVLDGVLTFWITLALLAAYLGQADTRLKTGWWCAAAIACGLGVLTKGPVAMVLTLIPLWTQRRLVASAPISWRGWLGFGMVVVAINLPWYTAVCWQRPEFVRYFLWQHNVERFVEPFDHVRPVWFYVPILLFGLLPTLSFARPLWRFLTSTNAAESQQRCPALGYLLLAGTWCVFFFSLAGSKLPTYILPAFPPFCLALGCFVARTDWHRSRWMIGATVGCWLLLACSHYVVIPKYARERSSMNACSACVENVPVICFPRNVDSVAFYVGRSDFQSYRSKDIDALVRALEQQPRTIVLFGHRNSPETLKLHLPPHLRMVERRPMGLCEMAVIVRQAPGVIAIADTR